MFSVGNTVDDHIIKKAFRPGEFGYVFQVEHPATGDCLALKQSKDGSNSDSLRRFGAENEILKKLNHPNIIKSKSDTKINSTGLHYFMELADYELEDLIFSTKILSFDQKMKIFTKICLAVQHAHQEEIVHRDLYWRNILIKENSNILEPKVSDFGAAKDFNASDLSNTPGDKWGIFFVKPPEAHFQIYSEADFLNYSLSDVYALGVICYSLFFEIPHTYFTSLVRSIRMFFSDNNISDLSTLSISERNSAHKEWMRSSSLNQSRIPIDSIDVSQVSILKKIIYGALDWNNESRIQDASGILGIIDS